MNRTSRSRLTPLPKIALAIFCALALLATACSGSVDSAAETVTTPADQVETDTGDSAPDELAEVELDDAMAEETAMPEETAEADPSEDGAATDPAQEDAEGPRTEPDAADELAEAAGIDLNQPGPIDMLGEEASACMDEVVEARPELQQVWNAIITDEAAAGLDDAERETAVAPILECVSFGDVVSAVISENGDVELSAASVSCMDSAMVGNEALLLDLISSDKTSAVDNSLIAAMVECVTADELIALMESDS